jgi:hypothetical protein
MRPVIPMFIPTTRVQRTDSGTGWKQSPEKGVLDGHMDEQGTPSPGAKCLTTRRIGFAKRGGFPRKPQLPIADAVADELMAVIADLRLGDLEGW